LCWCRRLQEHGIAPLVLQASDGIGGRVRTDVVDAVSDLFERPERTTIAVVSPGQAPPALAQLERPVRVRAGLYACGDHLDTGSIEGAIRSRRRAADALASDLGRARRPVESDCR
jgi:predicted NAD/FAD-dependent oxidoreductase